ncbi:MAG: hypothetical protein DMF90_04385 [Acidobacteria bacterium]|nr:MAG: hypothetical protein DMF90_04385 [Acidobacteriota bacterium]
MALTSTSLGLQALFKTAVVQSGMSGVVRGVSGLTPSAAAFYVAAAAAAMPRGAVLHVVASDRDLDLAVADCRLFVAALEGLSASAAEHAVLPFPSQEVDPYRGLAPHFGVSSARARALHALAGGTARVIVASAAALLPRVSSPRRLLGASLDLRPDQEIAPSDLAELLIDAGFRREDPADERGEFALRGGILDVYPAGDAQPVRVEFIGDNIETLRTYDPGTQRSIAPIDQLQVVPLSDQLGDRTATVFDYLTLGNESRLIVSEPDEVEASLKKLVEQLQRSYEDAIRRREKPESPGELFADQDLVHARLSTAISMSQLGLDDEAGGATAVIRCQPAVELHGRVGDWVSEIGRLREGGDTILFVAGTPGRAERTIELLKEYGVLAAPLERAEDARYAAVLVATGSLSRGFRLPDAGLQIYAEADVFDEERGTRDRRRPASHAFLSSLRDLKVGDLVVHVDHGIGGFVGLKQIGVGEGLQEFLELRYAGDDKLFVPIERLDLVQKYSGATRPPLDRLGGTTWERAKTRVKKAMRDMAEELLKLYAARRAVRGHAFSPDSHWQQEFEDAFAYELTPDQQSAVTEIKRDMEAATPMDRLLCGDVGYGKTEVALRAAFKAVMDGKQVAVLAPTTVLAFQHEKTLKERFAGFPVRIEMVSRFRSKTEQKAALTDLAAGKVDIVVGTHRLLSKDVEFRDLGLLVVDEEQRFGVGHKEKIKQVKRKVDVLKMSEDELERAMLDFVGRKHDILLATTIVENGLDIPNANTIIINRADRYGLSQLYQLRGRVGRSDRPAYAYLLIPPEDNLSPVAKKRLAAIKEFSDLGSGFRVAALDLEIRGAGNLLGGEQSGHIEAVGFEMYMKLLEETVRELKGEELEDDVRANVNLRVDLRIEDSYVADMNQRLMLYRKVAAARRESEIEGVLEEAQDRYGPLPESMLNLAAYGRIRVMANRLGVETIDRDGRDVVFKFRPQTKLDPVRLIGLIRRRGDLTLVPPSGLKLSLGTGVSSIGKGTPVESKRHDLGVAAGVKRRSPELPAASWWTTRARTGEVQPGFRKAEILRGTIKEDPKAPGGLFERVGELLSTLAEQM